MRASVEVAHADRADFLVRHQIRHRAHLGLDRREAQGIVHLVEVDGKGSQTAQALLDGGPDGLCRSEDGRPLGGHHHLAIGLSRVSERRGQRAFRSAIAVHFSGVEPVDATRQRSFHHLVHHRLRNRLPKLPGQALTGRELPAAQPDRGHLDVRLAQPASRRHLLLLL